MYLFVINAPYLDAGAGGACSINYEYISPMTMTFISRYIKIQTDIGARVGVSNNN